MKIKCEKTISLAQVSMQLLPSLRYWNTRNIKLKLVICRANSNIDFLHLDLHLYYLPISYDNSVCQYLQSENHGKYFKRS
jgi:hypothetical protein